MLKCKTWRPKCSLCSFSNRRPILHRDCVHRYVNIIILTAIHAGLIDTFFYTALYDANQIRCRTVTIYSSRVGREGGTMREPPPGERSCNQAWLRERGAMAGQGGWAAHTHTYTPSGFRLDTRGCCRLRGCPRNCLAVGLCRESVNKRGDFWLTKWSDNGQKVSIIRGCHFFSVILHKSWTSCGAVSEIWLTGLRWKKGGDKTRSRWDINYITIA